MSEGLTIERWAVGFGLDEVLRGHVVAVLAGDGVPEEVRRDLVDDPNFRLFDYEPGAGGMHVPVGMIGKGASRVVVLKRTLRARGMAFIRYVIAHELAHAYLRNEGRVAGEDPEFAADALAEAWGWPRPW